MSRSRTPFTSETDLAPPVLRLLAASYPSADIFEEIDLRWTAPDVVVGVTRGPASGSDSLQRLSDGPPLSPASLTFAELLEEEGPLSRNALLAHTSLRWTSLRRDVLEPLERRRVAVSNGETWEFCGWPEQRYVEVHTVELKLRAWRYALAQATRNQLFSTSSWVALPAPRIAKATVEEATLAGLGLISVTAEAAAIEVEAAIRAPSSIHASTRRSLEEHLLEARLSSRQRRAGSRTRRGDQRAFSQTARKSGFSPFIQVRAIPA